MSALNALFILLGVFKVFFHICRMLSGMNSLVMAWRLFPLVTSFVLSLVSTFFICSIGACIVHAFSIFPLTFSKLVCTILSQTSPSAEHVIKCSNVSLSLLQCRQLG